MGFWDFLKRGDNKSDKLGHKPKPLRKEVARWADKAADKRAQNYDRQEAIAALADLCQPLTDEDELAKTDKGKIQIEEHGVTQIEAATALFKRFNFVIDPSITDQEEKQLAFDGIMGAGKGILIPLRAYAAKTESLGWPMRILKAMLHEDEVVAELLEWLSKWDTEYAKFVDPKVQLLSQLEEHKDPAIREAVAPFLMDVNEPSRFHAVGATLAQDDPAAIPALVDMFIDEESLRIRNRVCEGFMTRGWAFPEESWPDARKSLSSEYTIDGEGLIRKRGG
jgi:hypothetical protein